MLTWFAFNCGRFTKSEYLNFFLFLNFLWSAFAEKNSAEMWEEWVDGADLREGVQWHLPAVLPVLPQVSSQSKALATVGLICFWVTALG